MMKIIFFHIPKTAGTTLQELLHKNNRQGDIYRFRSHIQLTTPEIKEKMQDHKVILGHFRFRDELMAPENFLFTFLREPIDRCISHFFHFRRQGRFEKGDIKEQFKFFLSDEEIRLNGNFNLQTQFMAGLVKQKDFIAEPQKHLALAKENIRKLNFIGIAEEFESSVFLLGELLSWKKWYYIRHNKGDYGKLKAELRKDFEDELIRVNKLDIELYSYALELFQNQKQQIAIPAGKKWKARGLSFIKTVKKKL